jgi:pre-mRNA-processing factor 19
MEEEIGPDGKKIRPGINPVMIDELTECNTMLSAQRKKRQVRTSLHSYKK